VSHKCFPMNYRERQQETGTTDQKQFPMFRLYFTRLKAANFYT